MTSRRLARSWSNLAILPPCSGSPAGRLHAQDPCGRFHRDIEEVPDSPSSALFATPRQNAPTGGPPTNWLQRVAIGERECSRAPGSSPRDSSAPKDDDGPLGGQPLRPVPGPLILLSRCLASPIAL